MLVRDAARALGVHTNTIRNYMDRGLLTFTTTDGGNRRPDALSVLALTGERVLDPGVTIVADRIDEIALRHEVRAAALRSLAQDLREAR